MGLDALERPHQEVQAAQRRLQQQQRAQQQRQLALQLRVALAQQRAALQLAQVRRVRACRTCALVSPAGSRPPPECRLRVAICCMRIGLSHPGSEIARKFTWGC